MEWRWIRSLVALLVGSCLTGCSALQPHHVAVTIEATAPGAEVSVNGRVLGASPVTAQVPRNEMLTVVARQEGWDTAVVKVPYRMSVWGFADAVGAYLCLCPGIGLLTPGAWEPESKYILVPMTAMTTNEPAPATHADVHLRAELDMKLVTTNESSATP